MAESSRQIPVKFHAWNPWIYVHCFILGRIQENVTRHLARERATWSAFFWSCFFPNWGGAISRWGDIPQQIVFVKNVGNIWGVSLESMPEVPEVHVPYLCTEWVNDVVWWKTSWKNCFPVTQFSNGNLPFLGGGNSNIFGIFTPDPWVVHHPIWRAYFSDGLLQPPKPVFLFRIDKVFFFFRWRVFPKVRGGPGDQCQWCIELQGGGRMMTCSVENPKSGTQRPKGGRNAVSR